MLIAQRVLMNNANVDICPVNGIAINSDLVGF